MEQSAEDDVTVCDLLVSSVLLVEDEPSDLRLVTEALREAGIAAEQISTAGSLAEARRALSEGRIDCVMLDLSLPDAFGLQAIRALATIAPHVPIVVVSGQPADGTVYEAMAEGADEYLCKGDLEPGRLRDLIERAARRRAGVRRSEAAWGEATTALDGISAPAAALDGGGRIVAVNDAWGLAALSGGATPEATGVGVNYLSVCEHAVGPFAEGAREAATGIRAVLRGEIDRYAVDYPCSTGGLERWFTLRVTPIGELGGGAIATHLDITALKHAERTFNGSELSAIGVDESAPIFALLDADGRVARISPLTVELLGLGDRSPVGHPFTALVAPEDARPLEALLARIRTTPDVSERLRLRVRDGVGRWHELDVSLTNLLDRPANRSIVLSGADVSDARRAMIRSRLESRLLDRLPVPTVICDERGIIVYLNDQAASMLHLTRAGAEGRSVWDLALAPDDPRVEAELAETLFRDSRWEGTYDIVRQDGSTVPVRTTMEVVRDPEVDFVGIVAAWMDLSDRRQLEEDLARQALHDPLTGLANRRRFVDHLDESLARRRRDRHPVGVVFLDLDDFKAVNDRMGHIAGDAVLRRIGDLIEASVGDRGLVARFGGDEFMVCCEGMDRQELEAMSESLLGALAGPFSCEGQLLSIGASLGLATADDESTANDLIQGADAAMYAAKEGGKRRLVVFDAALRDQVQRANRLAAELDGAIAAGDLRTEFQPQYDLRSGELVGFEALARWTHPEEGPIAPTEFIRIAERTGQIRRIGARALADACAAVRTWIDVAPERRCEVAVNVSPHELTDPSLPPAVEAAIAAARVPAGRICLEITESALDDPHEAARALRRLKEIGVKIALDDFGTGYSSLSRLHRFPLDYLKIDRSFVAGMSERGEDEMIVALVLGIGQAMGVEVIAEGVESTAQLDKLAALGCPVGQGHLFDASLPADEALRLVEAGGADVRVVRSQPGRRPAPSSGMTVDVDAALALLAHELAAPITVLSGWAEILSTSTDTEEIQMAAEAIHRAADVAQGAVELIRDAASSDTGNLGLQRAPVDVRTLVHDAVSATSHLLDHPIRYEVPSITVDADARAVVATLVNLIRNASRHVGPTASVQIRAESDGTSGVVRLHVIDDGPGVPAEMVGTIFRRFGRANTTVRGTGLGLYVGRAIARAHGGDLRYRQARGGGADFVLELPSTASVIA